MNRFQRSKWPLARTSPRQPIAVSPGSIGSARTPRSPVTQPHQVLPLPPRRSRAARIAIGIGISLLLLAGIFLLLLLTGQTEIVAWLLVAGVLLVVFGTPLLCLVGLIAFWFWALTRAGQRRYGSQRAAQATPAPPAHPVIVGEVVFERDEER